MASQHHFSTVLETTDSNMDSTKDSNLPLMLPYPQGCLQWCNNGMIVAAGGGGPTRSGKANGFEILQFVKQKDHQFELKRHSWYKTGLDIVYCIRQHPKYPYHFIAAIGNNLVIMEISSTVNPAQNNAFQWHWNAKSNTNPICRPPIQTICVRANIESTTLPEQEDVLWVNRVAICASGRIIASGGTDGIVRLWKYDFIDPNNTLCLDKTINITHQHFARLKRERKENEEIPIIERLLFYKNKYLSICNRECACYIWNIEQQKMETVLMDRSNKAMNLIFRDSVFMEDGNDTYCVCAVNEVRKSRKSRDPPSYLYQYYIPSENAAEDGWYRRHYCKIINADVIRMIGDMKTKNIITMHSNGIICVLDGLNLNKLYSFKNGGMFFTDIAISPNLYGNKGNSYMEYLLSSFGDSVLIKPIRLKPCHMQTTNTFICCRFRCCVYLLSILMVIVGIWIALVQPDTYP